MTHHEQSGDERDKSVREGFGDDGGTRVGRPDAPIPDDRSMARLADQQDSEGIEGSVLGDTSAGARATRRADGSSMSEGQASHQGQGSHDTKHRTNDHTQRAESGMGGEANRGVEGAQRGGASIPHGTDEESSGGGGSAHTDRAGSEPLSGREREHKPSYGGEGGSPRTSSDQRERH
jgi:hypothetical protein